MKKILALSIAIAMTLISVPALADESCPDCIWPCDREELDCKNGIKTVANVVGCGGTGGGTGGGASVLDGAPIIKCKWEYDESVLLPPADECCPDYCVEHDACPYEPGLQVKPVLGDFVTVGYYAIITDPQGVGHIDHVYVDVWHPNRQFKYQFELKPLGLIGEVYDKTQALQEWAHVKAHHSSLITYGEWDRPEGWTKDQDILDELEEEEAYLYWGTAKISYCQPAGWYTVGVMAIDGLDTWSDYLLNKFWYIPTAAVAIDFKTVDYGEVVESVWQQVGGDKVMGTEKLPTVKNIGNTPVYFTIKQDDMGFGKTEPNWNVEYKARLGKDGIFTDPYEPNIRTRIPGYLGMCIEEKLDFLIHVIKGFPDGQPNEGLMSLCAHIYGDPPMWISPKTFPPAPQGVPQEAPPVP
jgi:hypothetical protein